MFSRSLSCGASRVLHQFAKQSNINAGAMTKFALPTIKTSTISYTSIPTLRSFSTLNSFSSQRIPSIGAQKVSKRFFSQAEKVEKAPTTANVVNEIKAETAATAEAAASTESKAATAEAATSTEAKAAAETVVDPTKSAYADKFHSIDPKLVEEKRQQIRSRMKYFRLFTVCWLLTYLIGSKKFYTTQVNRFQDPAALQQFNSDNQLHHLYQDATRDKWADMLTITYNHNDDLNDRKQVQKLVLKHVLMSQQLSVMLKEAQAELLRLHTKYSHNHDYRKRFNGKDPIVDWIQASADAQEKLNMSGVTSLLAYNHDMEDDEHWYSSLNPLTRASKKASNLALADAMFYPLYAKLALRRINSFVVFVNSIMNDDWYADNSSRLRTDQFEELFSFWEQQQGFNRYHYEPFSPSGAFNIEPNCTHRHIASQLNHNIEEFKLQQKPLALNALTFSPIEQRTLSLPDPNQVLDLTNFPPASALDKVDLHKDFMDEDKKEFVPRSFWYYTPLPPLPTQPASKIFHL